DSDSENKRATTDPLVEKVKKQGMDSYQRKMLDCLIRPGDVQTGFKEVHLPDATIDTVRTLVSLRLLCPEAFKTGILKQYNMSGVLLFGPPGTGKTLLAKAIAKESGARMISIKPSDILDKCVGEDEKNINALFKLARRLKPCVIFIDEVDALFGARTPAKNENSSRWRTDMLTQFTQEMDGMLSSDVFVIGATNRPFDLDDAIIRRLPCRILVDLPQKDGREAILRILLKDELLEPDVDLENLASLTSNFSGSDLKHVCVMAAFESAKELANISWADKKGKESTPISSVPGISTPAASDSGKDSPPSPSLINGLAELSSTPNVDSTGSNGAPLTRKLAKRHFTQALKQIRASTSETQTSLVELRRWNDQFGSGNQSDKTGGYRPGSNLPSYSRPTMNGPMAGASGMGTSGTYSSGMFTSGMNGIGTSMSGMNMPTMSMSGMNTVGTGASGVNPPGLNAATPAEGSYLHSLGVRY
ncbi:hypothetical protein FRC11_005215, partial [Ceratobasidium sp. 423]